MTMKVTRFARTLALIAAGLPLALTESALARPADSKGIELYEKKIRPLFAQHCYKCHSSESEKLKGGLMLDSMDGWMAGGDSGEAVDLETPDESLLIVAVRYDDEDLEMPPKGQISESEIADLLKWIRLGAPGPQHNAAITKSPKINLDEGRTFWAFRPPKSLEPPEIQDDGWAHGSIDRFIRARIESERLESAGEADRQTWIRRVTFDLIGLPPAPDEIDAFVNDASPGAFQKVVDRLLESPHFGEHWGRHWLDVARYAESTGKSRNFPYSYAWKYRDYVFASFNEDKPFDQFIREQIAGDLLPAKNDVQRDLQRVATGFLALGTKELNERNPKKYQMDNVDEQIDVLSRSILALTVSCARCHDHKFDPIPTDDYYALAGIFQSTRLLDGLGNKQGAGNRFHVDRLIKLNSYAEVAGEKEAEPAVQALDQQRARLQKQYQTAQQELKELTRQARKKAGGKKQGRKKGKKKGNAKRKPNANGRRKTNREEGPGKGGEEEVRGKELNAQIAQAREEVRRLKNKLKKFDRKNSVAPPASTHLAMGVAEVGQAADCRVHIRGEIENLGSVVPRGFIQVVSHSTPSPIPADASGRVQLADWLTSRDNPLTARVAANRIWHHLFGRGLVATVDNFGASGEPPSHPELLDYLAVRFMDQGWSVKKLIREIVLSRTYRQSSEFNADNHARDPENIYLWRMNERRMVAESIRDAMLMVSGGLQRTPAEHSTVMKMKVAEIGRGKNASSIDSNATRYHRSAYVPIVRGFVPNALELFDFAEPSMVNGRRDVTTVATQALYMMNSGFVLDESRQFADRLLAAEDMEDEERVNLAYRLALGRIASKPENGRAIDYVRLTEEALKDKEKDPHERQVTAWSGFCQSLFACAEFRYVR